MLGDPAISKHKREGLNMHKHIRVGSLCFIQALGFGCIKAKDPMTASYNSSRITSVRMQIPSRIGAVDVSGKITGYNLQVKKTGGDCEFTDLIRTEKVEASDVKIDAKLKQDCDYSITLSFGSIAADSQALEKVYLTSDSYEGKPARPALVKKEDLKGKSEITVKACVSVTALGAQELGVNAAECPSISDHSIGESPKEPTTPPPPSRFSSNMKLSKTMSGTAEGYEVFFSGEISSTASVTKYCAIGFDVYYEAATPKLVVFEDAFIEVKPNEKLSLNKSITVDAGPLSGPLSFSEIRVLEQCSDQRPAITEKAGATLMKCYADKNCPVVRP